VGVLRHVGGRGRGAIFSQRGQRIFVCFYGLGDFKVVDHCLRV